MSESIVPDRITLGVRCIICGETVELDQDEQQYVEHGGMILRVCSGCADAVRFVKENREKLEEAISPPEIITTMPPTEITTEIKVEVTR